MNRLLRVGLTGGIGSGKSTVARLLSMLGAAVYVADERAKRLMVADPTLRETIIYLFGPAAYGRQGALNRAYLAEQVFGDPERLACLNGAVHPAVERDFLHWVSEQERLSAPPPYVVEEAAILIESGAWRQMDRIVVVTAPLEIRLRRVMARDGVSIEDAQRRVDAQMGDEERMRYAHHTMVSDDRQLLIPQVITLHRTLCGMAEEI